ncbi:LytTR family transcriptional regulator DNA-binding domain-containing protein [Flavobacterium sp. CAU 1735]|uniref:LytR/AlgR family response regulator transcription factor n=1 Tax=Flavobacterium sp. CAU 1735 TaxID=3140361 RepID=UPI00326172E4
MKAIACTKIKVVHYPFLLIDDDEKVAKNILEVFEDFEDFLCLGVIKTKEEAINRILELKPKLVFIEIASKKPDSDLSFAILSELNEFLEELPYFVVLTSDESHAFEAIKKGVSDYLLKPLSQSELRKCLLRFQKKNPVKEPETICVKSYGDYQFVHLKDITHLKADNNTTDIYLSSGQKVSAYKTLKHFESLLPFYFLRVHNSSIVNINYVSRIHLGKLKCYLNNNEISIPFSKSYKDNIDTIIRRISS